VPRVEVSGALQLELDGRRIDVAATGSRLSAEISSLAAPRPTLRLIASTLTLARRLSRTLDEFGLTFALTRDGRPVLELGAGVRSHAIAKLFGFRRIRLYRRRRAHE
jgi:hypothetical protein